MKRKANVSVNDFEGRRDDVKKQNETNITESERS